MKNKEKISGIYVIWSPTNKFYVGQSWDVMRRINGYKKLRANGQPYLLNSLMKYGQEKHKFKILKKYEGTIQSELNLMEKNHWLRILNDGYESLNCREPNGSNGRLSEETRKKLSLLRKGRIAPNKGIPLSSEQKEKLLKANLGKVRSNETKEKLRLANSGENNSSSKLKLNDVNNIKMLLKSGIKQIQIAKQFNISKQTISNIKLGINWNK